MIMKLRLPIVWTCDTVPCGLESWLSELNCCALVLPIIKTNTKAKSAFVDFAVQYINHLDFFGSGFIIWNRVVNRLALAMSSAFKIHQNSRLLATIIQLASISISCFLQ